MGIGQGDKDARFLKVDKSNKSVWVSADGISPNVTERYDLIFCLFLLIFRLYTAQMIFSKYQYDILDAWFWYLESDELHV